MYYITKLEIYVIHLFISLLPILKICIKKHLKFEIGDVFKIIFVLIVQSLNPE
ncbi:hypothetical protein SAMN05444338_11072 [Flavobacterium degerlachei]|jgi:hypothetical protein|uniref:Uncharacterized protein n=1 Tax=Flavobacterium degerlachei TaxID=229203 RepID=A0A1H3BP06_9FLAO|nr:hypothetical protein SAMN05444338_11072 [Flavobacterium degerlachei]